MEYKARVPLALSMLVLAKLANVAVQAAPVFVDSPASISEGMRVLDYTDSRLVVPFDSSGKANSREEQRQKKTWEFPNRYVEGQEPYIARFADIPSGIGFEIHSASPLGSIMEFAKTPQGYLLVFTGEYIRAVWIDPSGVVLKDFTLPNGWHSEVNFNGQTAVAQDGSLYGMISTKRGIEVHAVSAP